MLCRQVSTYRHTAGDDVITTIVLTLVPAKLPGPHGSLQINHCRRRWSLLSLPDIDTISLNPTAPEILQGFSFFACFYGRSVHVPGVCMCVGTCVYEEATVCACMCGGERSKWVLIIPLHPFFIRTRSLTCMQSASVQVCRLASSPWTSPGLYVPSNGSMAGHRPTWHLCWC